MTRITLPLFFGHGIRARTGVLILLAEVGGPELWSSMVGFCVGRPY